LFSRARNRKRNPGIAPRRNAILNFSNRNDIGDRDKSGSAVQLLAFRYSPISRLELTEFSISRLALDYTLAQVAENLGKPFILKAAGPLAG
jgi:hypothetical protein